MSDKTLARARSEAKGIVRKWAAGAALVGWVPGSSLILGTADIAMVNDLAKAYEVHHYSIEEIATVVGATVAGRVGADVGLSLIPVLGWVVKAGVAGGVTYTAGQIIIKYFEDRTRLT